MIDILLKKLVYSRLDFSLEATCESYLPRYLGSTLRGALGWALRSISCSLKCADCKSCLLSNHCAYSVLFERYASKKQGLYNTVSNIPCFMVLEPPEPRDVPYQKDEKLSFSVLLFTEGLKFIPQLLMAVEKMSQKGLGKEKFKFNFLSAVLKNASKDIILRNNNQFCAFDSLPCSKIIDYIDFTKANEKVRIDMLTPLKLNTKGQLEIPFSFRSLARNLFARASSLSVISDDLIQKEQIANILEKTHKVEILEQEQKRCSFSRWSNRQKQKHDLEGAGGYAVWQGEAVAQLWPLLKAGEIMHAGKSTLFGFGKYKVTSI